MALQSITNISVDFSDKRYISINAKQFDRKSRFLSVTCRNYGEPFQLYSGEHAAFIRYKKPDGYSVFHMCDITPNGKVLVELTEQMLATVGICYADLVIVNRGNAVVDKDTGEITAIEDTGILSTMTFHIDVSETVIENSEVESSYEFDGLNDLLEDAAAEYSEVVRMSKSWAVGGTGERAGENTDNAKYYSQQSKNSANGSAASETNAKTYMDNAKAHMTDALTYSQNSQTYMGSAKTYMEAAKTSETNAKNSESNAKTSETNTKKYMDNAQIYMNNAATSAKNASDSEINAKASEEQALVYLNSIGTSAEDAANSASAAKISETNALSYMNNAKTSDTNASNSASAASTSETNAKTSETNAEAYMNKAEEYKDLSYDYSVVSQRYAVGGTNTVENEDVDNSKYYCEQSLNNAENAKTSETNALSSANFAKSYTVGDTGTRENEDTDNVKYYYEHIISIVDGLDSGFIPMGTITFSELATAEKATGFVYNISDDFVTDDTFREGAGKAYAAGTNVYYTADDYWDCFAGVSVTGIKGNNETIYRRGDVNLTPDNIGAIPSTDIATVDEVKEFLNIV